MVCPIFQNIIVRAEQNQENIGERLDGDYAYISESGLVDDDKTSSRKAIRTGTTPWDNEEGSGNDTTDLDDNIRSFDVINYTTYFRTKVRDNAPYNFYKTGTVHFQFIVPGTKSQIQYGIDTMSCLSAKKDVEYTLSEKEIDGKTYQVLAGSFLLEPNSENPSAIGESYQELTVMLRVLAMNNGEKVQPEFTYWLEDNQEKDYQTIKAPDVNVTAEPRYNVQLKTCDSRAQYVNMFDFSTGNEQAQNKDAGNVYGRCNVVGITLQIVGKSPDHGLKGCEIPDGKDIKFDIDVSSVYQGTDGKTTDTNSNYMPLLWSFDENKKRNGQADGREISGSIDFASGGAPFNSDQGEYQSCDDGGTWKAIQEGSTIHVTISGYKVNLAKLPATDANVSSAFPYYNPATIKNYWNIQMACFSGGELWLVQPFYDKDGNYVVDQYGTGGFKTTLINSNLEATGITGQKVGDQMIKTDDKIVLDLGLEEPGTIQQSVNYQKYKDMSYGAALTEGCIDNGKDWIVAGGQLNIQEILKHNSAEGMNTAVAYDDLVKFDDQFFDIESAQKGSNAGLEHMSDKILYGAKQDKTGWDHKGLNPSDQGYDDEMMKATADDLIFFSSLDELKEKGYTCVAVLWEARGLASAQSTNCYIGLQGKVSQNAKSGSVYMVTHSAKAWNKLNVAEAAAKYLNKPIAELNDSDYETYAKSEAFSTRADHMTPLNYQTDYEEAFWTNDYNTTDGLRTYQKSYYDENGYAGGSSNILSYADSCLVVDYATKITKNTMQNAGSEQGSKLAYDMDSNQRVADYVLNLSAVRTAGQSKTENASIKTDLYVEDTLPKGLTYVPYSAHWGGTYIQKGEGKQGIINGGESMEPEIIENDDGTTTLKWTLKNVTITEEEVTYFDSIYYSCDIGTPGVEETDVKNNDQLLNQAKIWGKTEPKREFTLTNGNLAQQSIIVTKNNAVSLSKLADKQIVDVGEDMGFMLNIGNNANNSMDIIAVDSLPYSGDDQGSDFTGECYVKEVTIQTKDLRDNIKLYYTDDQNEKGKTSVSYNKDDIEKSTVFKELKFDRNTGKVEIPDDFKPVSVVAVGTLPSSKTLKIHITLYLSEGKAGEHVVNRLTNGNLESDARTYYKEEIPVTGVNDHRIGIREMVMTLIVILAGIGSSCSMFQKRKERS